MTHYRVGDVIANSMDPEDAGFGCGSVKEVLSEGYRIHFFGDISFTISKERAVSLHDVLNQRGDDAGIIADKTLIDGGDIGYMVFVGGKVASKRLGSDERHCVKTPAGKKICIVKDHCISAMEAMRLIEPCPHSQLLKLL